MSQNKGQGRQPYTSPLPRQPPSLNIPSSKSTVSISIIDTDARMTNPMTLLTQPLIAGNSRFCAPTYSYLITHPGPPASAGPSSSPSSSPSSAQQQQRHLLFDLAIRKDYLTGFPPFITAVLGDPASDIGVTWPGDQAKDVADVLVAGGMALADVEAVIWSHHHPDHVGDVTRFPRSTALVVGPGFKDMFGEGWPQVAEAPLMGEQWAGRELREVRFDDDVGETGEGLRIGRFRAVDWFGDGSFYLLDSPGHAVGHLCGLARVRAGEGEGADDDAFVFMGGDCAHHAGMFRPSPYLPLPDVITPSPLPHHHTYGTACPAALFDAVHPASDFVAKRTTPFYTPALGIPHSYDQCMWSIEGMQEFDADNRVLVVNAHDESVLKGDGTGGGNGWLWPGGKRLNEWEDAGLKHNGRWTFLGDFVEDVAGGIGKK